MEVLVITPVKDSLDTTRRTIEAVSQAEGKFNYLVYNDFSKAETRKYLEDASKKHGFALIHLEEMTSTPSPNYRIILQHAFEKAIRENKSLILVESDVIVKPSTIKDLSSKLTELNRPGVIGAITVDNEGKFNFPYSYVKESNRPTRHTKHSISFCCTLLTIDFLKTYDFRKLPLKKDWFDIFISKKSRRYGFRNYLLTDIRVLHLPHSSRPWKQLKYTNPLKYYISKLIHHRDRI
jgi:hypothetical protein